MDSKFWFLNTPEKVKLFHCSALDQILDKNRYHTFVWWTLYIICMYYILYTCVIPLANWPFALHHISYFQTSILSYLHTFILSYLYTFIPSYLHTFILSYLHTFILSYLHTFMCTCVLPLASWPSPPPTAQRSSSPPTMLPPPLRGSRMRQQNWNCSQLVAALWCSVYC